ncbi:MAG: protein-glutamate O-methyltransferase CheR [Pseudomonadota bacterium]
MKITDFEIYKDLLREKSGLLLSQDQSYILESRLNPVAKKWGYDSLEAMTMVLQGVPDEDLITDIVEEMMMMDTSFFADEASFEALKNIALPQIKDTHKKKKIRIWSAGCSSGQEPYSLAIMLKDAAAQFPGCSFDILATDISDNVLEQAREGLYTQFEVQRGLPIHLLMEYFTQIDESWKVNKSIQKMVSFKKLNLMHPFTKMGAFDVILCCNTLNHFGKAERIDVLNRLADAMTPGGFLMLGKEDTPSDMPERFKAVPETQALFTLA